MRLTDSVKSYLKICVFCSIVVFLFVTLFFFYPLHGVSGTFEVDKYGHDVGVVYLDNESLNVENVDRGIVAFLDGSPSRSDWDYLVKVATEGKSFLQTASSCEHEFMHLELRDSGMSEFEDHRYMEGRVYDVFEIRPICYRFTIESFM